MNKDSNISVPQDGTLIFNGELTLQQQSRMTLLEEAVIKADSIKLESTATIEINGGRWIIADKIQLFGASSIQFIKSGALNRTTVDLYEESMIVANEFNSQQKYTDAVITFHNNSRFKGKRSGNLAGYSSFTFRDNAILDLTESLIFYCGDLVMTDNTQIIGISTVELDGNEFYFGKNSSIVLQDTSILTNPFISILNDAIFDDNFTLYCDRNATVSLNNLWMRGNSAIVAKNRCNIILVPTEWSDYQEGGNFLIEENAQIRLYDKSIIIPDKGNLARGNSVLLLNDRATLFAVSTDFRENARMEI
ncbi:hypothetical protein EIN_444500, partial [Entamoeba invadens IP1]